MTPTATGSTLGDFETLTRREIRPFSHSTTIRDVHDPGLRATLDVFSVVATEPLSALRGFVRTNDRPSKLLFDDAWNGLPETIMSLPLGDGDFNTLRLLTSASDLRFDVERFELPTRRIGLSGATDAVTTIEELKVRLGLPMVDVLKAAGVGKSTSTRGVIIMDPTLGCRAKVGFGCWPSSSKTHRAWSKDRLFIGWQPATIGWASSARGASTSCSKRSVPPAPMASLSLTTPVSTPSERKR